MTRARLVTVVAASVASVRRVALRALVLTLAAGVLAPRAADAQYKVTTISVPGSLFTLASGVNNTGQIVGHYTPDNSVFHGFLNDAGVLTTIDVPGATSTDASGINDVGRIVGAYTSSGLGHGFLYDAGAFTPFDVPGALGTGVLG